MEAGGFVPEDFENDIIDVWPENWPQVELFRVCMTQWRISFNGPIGLDYNIVFRLLDEEGLSRDDWKSWLSDIRVMEAAALNTMRSR